MDVGLDVRNIVTGIGTLDFFHAACSTISYRLEPEGWGTRFPALLTKLYKGCLPLDAADTALKEIEIIRSELRGFDPKDVVWDINDLSLRPPWGENISSDITSLADYFVTSGGRDLFDVIIECIELQKDVHRDMELVTLPPMPAPPPGAITIQYKP